MKPTRQELEDRLCPARSTQEYCNSVPYMVRLATVNQITVNGRKLKDPEEDFAQAIRIFCEDTKHPLYRQYRQEFEEGLVDELLRYYELCEEFDLVIQLKYFPYRATREYVRTLPEQVIKLLALASPGFGYTNGDLEDQVLDLLKTITQQSGQRFSHILEEIIRRHMLTEHYRSQGIDIDVQSSR